MATIMPFQGLRYNQEKIREMSQVVAPPYDVIDADAQNRYYQRHPYNIIRLEYGKIYPGDNKVNNRYTRAIEDFTAWLKEGVLVPEAAPALYLYEQEFFSGGEKVIRSGFIGGVKLEPYEKGIVLPHEETIPKHKADRLDLMRACKANFSPVFGLYADKENSAGQILRQAVEGVGPDISFTDETGESHRAWVITDTAVIGKVQRIMADKRIFIADGHHRYETALNYKKEREAQHEAGTDSFCDGNSGSPCCPPEGEVAYKYVMMTLVNLYDPGLLVLPTHRLIKGVAGLDINRLIEQIKENFTVEEYILGTDGSIQDLMQLMAKRGQPCSTDRQVHPHVFGLYTGKNIFYLMTLKNEDILSEVMPSGKSPAWRRLDVSVLHTMIIDKLLGINVELMAKAEHIAYSREEEESLAAVNAGEYQLAFFLNPTLVEEVTEVAGNGEKMPQKSTFFYPKLITGLVLNKL